MTVFNFHRHCNFSVFMVGRIGNLLDYNFINITIVQNNI